ncbi:MAG TPA: L,D-transpeptidase family protein [Rubrivivax sp.]|nr:L,D-transpeptidase family protein [Rubrivivax sp.]
MLWPVIGFGVLRTFVWTVLCAPARAWRASGLRRFSSTPLWVRSRSWWRTPWLVLSLVLSSLPPAAAHEGVSRWIDAAGQPTPLARQALALLADAPSHGLDPRDYGLPALQQQWAADPREAAPALETGFLDYLRDLRNGWAPAEARPAGARAAAFDAAAVLRAAAATGELAQAVRAAVPSVPQYERLRETLVQYRGLAGHPAWREPLPALPLPPRARVRALAPGQAWAGVPLLTARLAALGDLPAADAAMARADLYEGALVAAVQAFQRRHGLQGDGVIGPATLAALQVKPAARVQQLELALERLRWVPLHSAPRMIVVNIPEFVLRAYELQDERIAVREQMRVVVGRAPGTRTPLLKEDLRRIEFKPYWNVPPSIARNETIPRLRRDPAYWTREGFEFVGAGGIADPVLSEAKLQAVLAGSLRIRQRPGPRNALGDIKFVLPNRQSIYLHHTPSVQLFEQSRRDFSHGCIRVEHPVALAAFALAGLPDWDEARVRAAMAAAQPSTVALPQPVPVLLAYTTALVKDGRVHFFEDIYGHDRELARVLRGRRF